MKRSQSPCIGCRRVADPVNCENKNCALWRPWFISQWERSCAVLRRAAAPSTLQEQASDPCGSCLCPKELCLTPCQRRLVWLRESGEVIQ